ncbi:putative mucin/carbohydrate-binding domain-containing protein [Microbacterium sp. NPDC089188]|uniref:putative mucin/carbohydrate-binding domain-containing protein n=1 Tax=Microbacterium sp. NPDC089188 TaxID=3154971 RepID=UPI003413AEE7
MPPPEPRHHGIHVLGATSTALEVREATVIRHDETGASTRVLAINVGSMEGRLLAILQSSGATQEALTRTVPVTATSALGFVGIYDVRSGWIGMSRDGKRLVVTSTGVAPHDYSFTGKLYYQVALQNARGRTLVTVTVNGDDTHDKVVTALDGMSVSNGYRLLVTAAEPSRVRVYADSVQTGSLSMTPQTLTIRGGAVRGLTAARSPAAADAGRRHRTREGSGIRGALD